MFHRPGLFTVWLTGAITGGCLAAAYLLDSRVSIWFMILAGVTGVVCILSVADYVATRYTEHQVILTSARANTERLQVIRALGMLNEGQLDALMHANNLNAVLKGVEEEYITISGVDIPRTWAWHYLESTDYLPALRSFGEGSYERLWAKTLVNELLLRGWVKPAAGNIPAAWVNRKKALAALGLEE